MITELGQTLLRVQLFDGRTASAYSPAVLRIIVAGDWDGLGHTDVGEYRGHAVLHAWRVNFSNSVCIWQQRGLTGVRGLGQLIGGQTIVGRRAQSAGIARVRSVLVMMLSLPVLVASPGCSWTGSQGTGPSPTAGAADPTAASRTRQPGPGPISPSPAGGVRFAADLTGSVTVHIAGATAQPLGPNGAGMVCPSPQSRIGTLFTSAPTGEWDVSVIVDPLAPSTTHAVVVVTRRTVSGGDTVLIGSTYRGTVTLGADGRTGNIVADLAVGGSPPSAHITASWSCVS